jgi:hypothetical protein
MIPLDVPPICQVPGCKEGAQILSKQGDTVRYMITCRRHYAGQIKLVK